MPFSLDESLHSRRTRRLSPARRAGTARYRPLVLATVLGAWSFALYAGTLGHDFTFWDDDVYVTCNPGIRELSPARLAETFTSFSNCNYHPLTSLTYMVEFAAIGLSPWLYHLDNVLLHTAATIFAFFLSRRLLGTNAAAFAAAALFLAHPLRVESVAWVAERKEVLCTAFYLAALWAYTRHLDGENPGISYGAALGSFVLALLSKPMAVTLPAGLCLLLVYRRAAGRGHLLRLVPFALLSGVFAGLALWAQASCGAVKGLHGGSLASHLLSLPQALSFYSGKLLWPHPLSARYVLAAPRSLAEGAVLAGTGLALGALAATLWSLRRRRILFLGLGFFFLTWAPVSGIVPTSTLVADRYMYLPALGLSWPLAALLARGRCGPDGRPRPAAGWAPGWALLAVALVFWSALAVARAAEWKDGRTLWRSALQENPRNPFAHAQLALEALFRGDYPEVAARTAEASRLGFRDPRHLYPLCLAYRGLGDSRRELEAARGILAGAPEFVPAWTVVLRHCRREGRLEEVGRRLAELSARFPRDPDLAREEGHLEAARARWEEALARYVRSLELRENDREVLLAAALALWKLRDRERALALVRHAAELPGGVLLPGAAERLEELAGEVESEGSAGERRRLGETLASLGEKEARLRRGVP